MPRVNLLPWREQQRTDRKKAFGVGLGAALIAAGALTGVAWLMFNQMIDAQQTRNALLHEEIKTLDKQIEEINNLEQQKEQMLARMNIIEKLQLSRPEIVHIIDTFTRLMPDGMYLTSLTQTNQRFKIVGITQSPARVATLYELLDGSDWLKEAELGGVHENPAGHEFILYANQRVAAANEAEAVKGKAKDKRKKP